MRVPARRCKLSSLKGLFLCCNPVCPSLNLILNLSFLDLFFVFCKYIIINCSYSYLSTKLLRKPLIGMQSHVPRFRILQNMLQHLWNSKVIKTI